MKVDMDKICRVCLRADTEIFLIFDDKYSLDNHSLADILSTCTIYKVNRDDELPHHMCGDCVDLAKKAFIFKRDCEKAYRQLMSMISNTSGSQYTKVELSHRIKMESECLLLDKSTQTDHTTIYPNMVDMADMDHQNRETMKSVAVGADAEQVQTIECSHLGEEFLREIEYDNCTTVSNTTHSNRTSPVISAIAAQNLSQPDVKPTLNDEDEKPLSEVSRIHRKSFVEVLIDQATSSEIINSATIDPDNDVKLEFSIIPTSLLDDANSVDEQASSRVPANDMLSEDNDDKCPACSKSFHRRSTLQKHISSYIKEKPLSCEICMMCFSRSDFLKRHLHKKHNNINVSFKCDECDMNFTHSTQYKRHNDTKHNTRIKLHACDICQKSFTTKLYMKRHVQSHTKKRYMCKECAERFFTKDELNKHIKTEGHDKPLLCPICGFRCKTNNTLTIHMRRHKGEKPYKCKFCSKGFPRVDDLRIHEKYHTGEKSHFCEMCGKGFQRKYNLTIHMRVHTGEKPYQCSHCPQAFSQSNDLKSHIRRHTGERFRCEFCSAPFLQGYQMRQHKLSEHGVKENPPTQRLEKYTSPEEQEHQIKRNLKRELAKGMDLTDAESKAASPLEAQSIEEIVPIMNIQEEVTFLNI